jgi:hypothetical protein
MSWRVQGLLVNESRSLRPLDRPTRMTSKLHFRNSFSRTCYMFYTARNRKIQSTWCNYRRKGRRKGPKLVSNSDCDVLFACSWSDVFTRVGANIYYNMVGKAWKFSHICVLTAWLTVQERRTCWVKAMQQTKKHFIKKRLILRNLN